MNDSKKGFRIYIYIYIYIYICIFVFLTELIYINNLYNLCFNFDRKIRQIEQCATLCAYVHRVFTTYSRKYAVPTRPALRRAHKARPRGLCVSTPSRVVRILNRARH